MEPPFHIGQICLNKTRLKDGTARCICMELKAQGGIDNKIPCISLPNRCTTEVPVIKMLINLGIHIPYKTEKNYGQRESLQGAFSLLCMSNVSSDICPRHPVNGGF